MLHPGVTVLIQYDIQTSNNLHEVLYTYLLNDRSITRTASIMQKGLVKQRILVLSQALLLFHPVIIVSIAPFTLHRLPAHS